MHIFIDGTLANAWNSNGVPVVAFVIAAAATLMVLWRTPMSVTGMLAKTMAVMAFLATVPLALEHAGLRMAIQNYETVIFLDIVGTLTAVALGGFSFHQWWQPQPVEEAVPEDPEPVVEPEPEPVAWVMVERPDGGQETHALTIGSYRLGRDPSCDLVLDDLTVSRLHLGLDVGVGVTKVWDLGSVNRVRINGEETEAAYLDSGDRLELGNTKLTITLAPAEGRLTATARA